MPDTIQRYIAPGAPGSNLLGNSRTTAVGKNATGVYSYPGCNKIPTITRKEATYVETLKNFQRRPVYCGGEGGRHNRPVLFRSDHKPPVSNGETVTLLPRQVAKVTTTGASTILACIQQGIEASRCILAGLGTTAAGAAATYLGIKGLWWAGNEVTEYLTSSPSQPDTQANSAPDAPPDPLEELLEFPVLGDDGDIKSLADFIEEHDEETILAALSGNGLLDDVEALHDQSIDTENLTTQDHTNINGSPSEFTRSERKRRDILAASIQTKLNLATWIKGVVKGITQRTPEERAAKAQQRKLVDKAIIQMIEASPGTPGWFFRLTEEQQFGYLNVIKRQTTITSKLEKAVLSAGPDADILTVLSTPELLNLFLQLKSLDFTLAFFAAEYNGDITGKEQRIDGLGIVKACQKGEGEIKTVAFTVGEGDDAFTLPLDYVTYSLPDKEKNPGIVFYRPGHSGTSGTLKIFSGEKEFHQWLDELRAIFGLLGELGPTTQAPPTSAPTSQNQDPSPRTAPQPPKGLYKDLIAACPPDKLQQLLEFLHRIEQMPSTLSPGKIFQFTNVGQGRTFQQTMEAIYKANLQRRYDQQQTQKDARTEVVVAAEKVWHTSLKASVAFAKEHIPDWREKIRQDLQEALQKYFARLDIKNVPTDPNQIIINSQWTFTDYAIQQLGMKEDSIVVRLLKDVKEQTDNAMSLLLTGHRASSNAEPNTDLLKANFSTPGGTPLTELNKDNVQGDFKYFFEKFFPASRYINDVLIPLLTPSSDEQRALASEFAELSAAATRDGMLYAFAEAMAQGSLNANDHQWIKEAIETGNFGHFVVHYIDNPVEEAINAAIPGTYPTKSRIPGPWVFERDGKKMIYAPNIIKGQTWFTEDDFMRAFRSVPEVGDVLLQLALTENKGHVEKWVRAKQTTKADGSIRAEPTNGWKAITDQQLKDIQSNIEAVTTSEGQVVWQKIVDEVVKIVTASCFVPGVGTAVCLIGTGFLYLNGLREIEEEMEKGNNSVTLLWQILLNDLNLLGVGDLFGGEAADLAHVMQMTPKKLAAAVGKEEFATMNEVSAAIDTVLARKKLVLPDGSLNPTMAVMGVEVSEQNLVRTWNGLNVYSVGGQSYLEQEGHLFEFHHGLEEPNAVYVVPAGSSRGVPVVYENGQWKPGNGRPMYAVDPTVIEGEEVTKNNNIYRTDNREYVKSLDGHVYEVVSSQNTPDVVGLKNPKSGMTMRSLGWNEEQGGWEDIGLKGGGPKRRTIAQIKAENEAKLEADVDKYDALFVAQAQSETAAVAAKSVYIEDKSPENLLAYKQALVTNLEKHDALVAHAIMLEKDPKFAESVQAVLNQRGKRFSALLFAHRRYLAKRGWMFENFSRKWEPERVIVMNSVKNPKAITPEADAAGGKILQIHRENVWLAESMDVDAAEVAQLPGTKTVDLLKTTALDRQQRAIDTIELKAMAIKFKTMLLRADPLDESIVKMLNQLQETTHSVAAMVARAGDFDPGDIVKVLPDVIEGYEKLKMHYETIAGLSPNLEAFVADERQWIEDIIADANSLLEKKTAAMRPDEWASLPLREQKNVSSKSKTLIVTKKDKRVLVGEVSAEEPGTVKVTETRKGADSSLEVVTTYKKDPSGEYWEPETPESVAPKQPEPQLSKLETKEFKDQLDSTTRRADTLLSEAPDVLRGAEWQSERPYPPADVQDGLDIHAKKMREMGAKLKEFKASMEEAVVKAEELEKKIVKVQEKIEKLEETAVKFAEKGTELRIKMCIQGSPTPGNLKYLLSQETVSVSIEKSNMIKLKDGYMRKYKILINGEEWGAAHFHYDKENPAAVEDFVAAHIKTPDQERMGLEEQKTQARNGKTVTKILREKIYPNLAKEIFGKL